MRRALAPFACLCLGLADPTVPAGAADPKPLAIGSPAPDFRLPGVDGKTMGLKDFADARVLVVAFTCKNDHATMRTIKSTLPTSGSIYYFLR